MSIWFYLCISLDQSWSILVDLGRSWSNLVYLGLSQPIPVDLGQYWWISDDLVPYWLILDYLGLSWSIMPISVHLGLSRYIMLVYLGSSWAKSRLSSDTSGYLWLSFSVLAHLELFQSILMYPWLYLVILAILGYLEPSWTISGYIRLSLDIS